MYCTTVLPRSYNTPCSDSGSRLTKSPALITWRLIETKMCWGVLFLLGGGFTIAKVMMMMIKMMIMMMIMMIMTMFKGLQTSGLSTMLVTQLNK